MYDELMETAKKASYEFYRSNTHLDHREVVNQAYISMRDAIGKWDPNKGRTQNSWVAFIVKRELCNIMGKRDTSLSIEDIVDEDGNLSQQSSNPTHMNPEKLMIINESFRAFSQASKEIIQALFNEEIVPVANNKNAITREIKKHLRDKGYPWWKIKGAFKELREYANSLA